jgi:hypothetical protein
MQRAPDPVEALREVAPRGVGADQAFVAKGEWLASDPQIPPGTLSRSEFQQCVLYLQMVVGSGSSNRGSRILKENREAKPRQWLRLRSNPQPGQGGETPCPVFDWKQQFHLAAATQFRSDAEPRHRTGSCWISLSA